MELDDDPNNTELFLRVVRECAGPQGIIALRNMFGGTTISVPASIGSERHGLVRCLGMKAAQAVCAEFAVGRPEGQLVGLGKISIPLGRNTVYAKLRVAIEDRLTKTKASVSAIALELGCCERTVWRRRQELVARGLLKKSVPQARSGSAAASQVRG